MKAIRLANFYVVMEIYNSHVILGADINSVA